MTDRLKLSDPTGDAKIDKIVVAAEQEDRILQLRKEIAALQSELAKQSASAAPSPASGGNNKIGARKHGSFKAISTAPSINLTPRGPTMVPVPYPVVQDLSSSVNTARSVRFNGCPVYLLDASTQPHCTGDEQGTGKGIKSGTVSGEVKPVHGSSTVRIEGKRVVRAGDACTMNGGNCPGIYVTIPPTSGAAPKDALTTSNSSYSSKDPLSLYGNRTPAEKLATLVQQDTLDGTSALRRYINQIRTTTAGPALRPWNDQAEAAGLLRTRNSLSIALLGVFGSLGAGTRIAGGSEQSVAAANEVGATAAGVALAFGGIPERQAMNVAPRIPPPSKFHLDARVAPRTVAPGPTVASDGIKVVAGKAIDPVPAKDAFHATSGAKQAESILKGIDPKYLNPNSRFGKAFYVAEEPETALAEMAHYGIDPTTGIRFHMDAKAMKVLDLTNPTVAEEYGYNGGPISSETQAIGKKAREEGYNVIRFNSERAAGGVNNAVLDNYNAVLKPQIVTEIKK